MEIQQLQRFAAFIIDGRIPDNSKQFIIAFNKDTPEPAYDGDSGISENYLLILILSYLIVFYYNRGAFIHFNNLLFYF